MSSGCFAMLRNQDGWRAAPPSVAATSHEFSPSGKPPTGAVRVRPVFAPRVVRRTTGNPALALTRCSPERRYVRMCHLPMSLTSGIGTRAPRVPGGLRRMVTSDASRAARCFTQRLLAAERALVSSDATAWRHIQHSRADPCQRCRFLRIATLACESPRPLPTGERRTAHASGNVGGVPPVQTRGATLYVPKPSVGFCSLPSALRAGSAYPAGGGRAAFAQRSLVQFLYLHGGGDEPGIPAVARRCDFGRLRQGGSVDLGSNISPHAVRLAQLTGAPVSADGERAFLCVHERRD